MKNQKNFAHLVNRCENISFRKALVFLSFLSWLVLSLNSTGADGQNLQKSAAAAEKDTNSRISKAKSPLADIDSLWVIHFHPTVQCSCCINVGNFSKKCLEKHYVKPYQDGRIMLKECNIDEDSATAKKYEIFGSALGFEKFLGAKAEFEEIESVWEFCEEEKKFLESFRKEMDRFLNPSKKDTSQSVTESTESK